MSKDITKNYCPNVKAYQLKEGIDKAIEKQLAAMKEGRKKHFGPSFIKNGRKYHYKDITDKEITALWADADGRFQPSKCSIFEPVATATAEAPAKAAK